mgnify:CR=1 FL=1
MISNGNMQREIASYYRKNFRISDYNWCDPVTKAVLIEDVLVNE